MAIQNANDAAAAVGGYTAPIQSATNQIEAQVETGSVQYVDKVKTLATKVDVAVKVELDLKGDKIFGDLAKSLMYLAGKWDKAIGEMDTKLKGVIKDVTKPIEDAISGIAPSLTGAVGGVVSGLQGMISSLIDNLATIDEFSAAIIGQVRRHGEEAAEWVANAGAGALGLGLTAFLEILESEQPPQIDELLEELIQSGRLPPTLRGVVKEAKAKRRPIFGAIALALVGIAIMPSLGALVSPWVEDVRQYANRSHPIAHPDPSTLTVALRRGDLSLDQFETGMLEQGYGVAAQRAFLSAVQQVAGPQELVTLYLRGWLGDVGFYTAMNRAGVTVADADRMLAAARRPPTEQEARDAYLRGEISQGEHDSILTSYGYTPDAIELRRDLYQLIPGPNDLITMAVREVFSPDQRQELDLDAAFPEAFQEWAAKQGISEEWARNYWAAHWQLPSPNMVFEMLHRGIVDEGELDAYLQAADYAPVWRDKLKAISYAPFTRVDVRRMHALGILTEDQVTSAYMDIGYPLERAQQLTEFTVALNSQESANALEPFRSRFLTRVQSAFEDGIISEHDAAFMMKDLGYTDAEADAFLAEALLVREIRRADRIRDQLRKQYVRGFISWEDASAQLEATGFGPDEIAFMQPDWQEERDYRDLSEEEKRARDLTKSEVLRAYRDKIIPLEETDLLLTGLGYDERERGALIALEDVKAAKELADALQDAIKARFMRGMITRSQASGQLDEIEVASARRDALLDRWEADKIRAGERVPVTTVRDLWKGKHITEERAIQLLGSQGWPEDVTMGVIQLWR